MSMATHQFRVSEAAEILGVSDDTVRRWAESGRLTMGKGESGRQMIDGAELAAVATAVATSAGQDAASSAPSKSSLSKSSARNRMRGIVTKVTKDTVMAQVELQAGPFRLVSLMSREAVDELGLEVGAIAIASVKATMVVVELPEPGGR
jgi:molybdopterin-binding protein